jgi:hypothetical protein
MKALFRTGVVLGYFQRYSFCFFGERGRAPAVPGAGVRRGGRGAVSIDRADAIMLLVLLTQRRALTLLHVGGSRPIDA